MASEVIEKKIYGGDIHIIHNPNAKGRAPRYKVDGEPVKGVTTIMGKTLAKDLISWAVGMAQDYLRERLPVVTEEDLVEAGKAYMYRRDAGANTGSEAHAMVENYLKSIDGTDKVIMPVGSQEAQNAYKAFVKWFEEEEPEVINVEEVIYSVKHKYAGTYDCMLRINGKVVLCDLKTTNASRQAPKGVYAENFIQLGAYALAHEEQRQYELANGGTELEEITDLMVISCKKDGRLDVITAGDLGLGVEQCGEMFKSVINVFQFMEETGRKLA